MDQGHRDRPTREEAWHRSRPHGQTRQNHRPWRGTSPVTQVSQWRGRDWQETRPEAYYHNSHRQQRDHRPGMQVRQQRGRDRDGQDTRQRNQRGQVNQVNQVRHPQEYIHTPQGERDNNLLKTIRVINTLIVAQHHLGNCNTDRYPTTIRKKEQELTHLIKPAKPTDQTAMFLEGAAKHWAYTTVLILQTHFSTLIENTKTELSTCLTRDFDKAFLIAKGWAQKKLGKRLTPDTVTIAQTIIEDIREKTHTQTRVVTPQNPGTPHSPLLSPLHSPTPSPTTGNQNEEETPGEQTRGPWNETPTTPGPLVQSQNEFPDLTPRTSTRPEEPWMTASRKKKKNRPQRDPNKTPPSTAHNPEIQQSLGIPPRPQRSPRTRQTPPPVDMDQSTQRRNRGNRDPERNQETPTQTEDNTIPQRETEIQETTPGTIPRKPRRHAGGKRKHTWKLTPTHDIIIMGDSNLARIPVITDDRMQIESYSGMNIEWARTVIEKMAVSTTTSHLIISVGINNRNQKETRTSQKALEGLRKATETTFPNADRRIVVINYAEGLQLEEKRILTGINNEMLAIHPNKPNWKTIPKLARGMFQTEMEDRYPFIHWTKETAEAMLQHWTSCLN